jgi:ECF sigma factor
VRDAKLAELVDLRYFCGYTFEEIAAQRDTSVRTVKREWEKARALLFHQLKARCIPRMLADRLTINNSSRGTKSAAANAQATSEAWL